MTPSSDVLLAERVVGLCRMRPDLCPQQLADATGAAVATVYRTLRLAGLSAARKPRVQPPPGAAKKALKLLRKRPSLTAVELAARVGMTPAGVRNLLKRAGLQAAPGVPGRAPWKREEAAPAPTVVEMPVAPCAHRVCRSCESLWCSPLCRVQENPRNPEDWCQPGQERGGKPHHKLGRAA